MRFKNIKKIGKSDYDPERTHYFIPTNNGRHVLAWKINNKKSKKEINNKKNKYNYKYWCHGYTFGKSQYSPYGYGVKTILRDEWKRIPEKNAQKGDILVWYCDEFKYIEHSGRIVSTIFNKNKKLNKHCTKIANKHDVGKFYPKQSLNSVCRNYTYFYKCYRRKKI